MDEIDLFQIQLRPEGLWHRRSRVDSTMTACGQFIYGATKSRDRGTGRENHTCPICWPDEIDTAEMKKLERSVLDRNDADAYFDDDDEPTNPDFREEDI